MGHLSKDDNGLLYVVRCDTYYKIGHTRNMQGRLSALQTSSPHKLDLLFSGSFRWVADLEETLHKFYSAYRVRGEWFELPENELGPLLRMLQETEKADRAANNGSLTY